MNKQIKRVLSIAILGITCLGAGSLYAAATTEGRDDLLPLGTKAPDFSLVDVVTGKSVSLADFASKKVLIVMFICRHCPYVQHVKKAIAVLGLDYANKSVGIVAISANDPAAYPDDAPASLAEMAKEEGFNFPLLFDETQDIAKAYTAVATPDTFIFDETRKLVYRGQLDDTRPDGEPATAKDVRAAIENLLAGKPVNLHQKPSVGCSIKWKKYQNEEIRS